MFEKFCLVSGIMSGAVTASSDNASRHANANSAAHADNAPTGQRSN